MPNWAKGKVMGSTARDAEALGALGQAIELISKVRREREVHVSECSWEA